jgi:hypothetical protein
MRSFDIAIGGLLEGWSPDPAFRDQALRGELPSRAGTIAVQRGSVGEEENGDSDNPLPSSASFFDLCQASQENGDHSQKKLLDSTVRVV